MAVPDLPLAPERRDAIARRLAEIARAAGRELERHRSGCASRLKADGSPVSDADNAAEALIAAELAAAFPGWPVVSEERETSHGADPGPLFFLVDPLDGTRPFLRGEPDFCVLIALIAAGTPVAGALSAPALGCTFWAGATARKAGADLADSRPVRLAPPGARVAIVSRDESGETSRPLCAECGASEILRENSAVKFVRLMEGEADVYPRIGRTMQWDIAAGDALLRAIGGGVFDLAGAPLVYGPGALGWANPDFVAWRRAPG